MPTGTARCRSRGRSRTPARTDSASRRSTRRWSCGPAASGRRSWSCIRCRRMQCREAAAAGVALTLGDETLAERAIEAIEAAGDSAPVATQLEVHLEVETGLGRGGLDPAALPRLVDRLRRTPAVRLAGVWSHLGSADDPGRSGRQRRSFEAAARLVGADAHLAASGGLLAGSAPPWQRVRPGLSIYGLVPEGAAGPRRSRAGGRRPPAGAVAPCPPGARRRPARRHGDQLRRPVRDGEGQPHRDAAASATRTATSASAPGARRPWCGACGCRWSGRSRWTP